MKVPKSILQAMLVALTTGAIVSCEKPRAEDLSTPGVSSPKGHSNTDQGTTIPVGCPACGMG